ncbi:DUF29 domain-containing protein [Caenispirillum bisanense]|uniref:DUF29 domain-containing protein n=1 Tax=Caenispirillum bisanense TaxID=414052 RepID=A0A286GLF2_9PROT|nr:DUF29 domain-containing protein [Caenispirillum bisanense]SOD95814.1 protein of unknown function DUF29 [Caenispirillum bisanense]
MATAKRFYDADFYAWTQDQAALLRDMRGVNTSLDVEYLAEEVAGMGRAERRAMAGHAATLLMHLLKWAHQPDRRSPSWRVTIRESRRQIGRLLDDSPSLRGAFEAGLPEWYADAREDAADETGLPPETFPAVMALPVDRLLDCDWLPE